MLGGDGGGGRGALGPPPRQTQSSRPAAPRLGAAPNAEPAARGRDGLCPQGVPPSERGWRPPQEQQGGDWKRRPCLLAQCAPGQGQSPGSFLPSLSPEGDADTGVKGDEKNGLTAMRFPAKSPFGPRIHGHLTSHPQDTAGRSDEVLFLTPFM